MPSWPSGRSTIELDVAGGTTFCHATPRFDDDLVTRLTPDDELAAVLEGTPTHLVVAGHTHMQVDRLAGGHRFVVAGSVGRPYEGRQGAFWALLGDDVELAPHRLRRRERSRGDPGDRLPGRRRARRDPARSAAARRGIRVLREPSWRVASSRRRGAAASGRGKQRIGPIVERLAEAHADAEIALHFGSDVELLISVMLSAQTTDVNVNRVTEKLFVKYRTPEDYLAVPVEELEQDIFQTGFYRQKTKSIRGAMRMLIEEFDGAGAADDPGAAAAARRRAQDGERRRCRARRRAGHRRRHARAPDLAAARR